ncbi:hypothetical protein ABAC460_06300 [Asticcacaulis sp. AC460]|uniref:hypothetical protein n=1 Tax=Asticcacaulis sp. AC460 TaxID=1282360 RepID=UPI0003C3EB76|nr:hypothetical protein [Asticcacaulis sp. AC460]ESQ91169.1 hypothetical protein ABAC460_06300 [Asticcacaulis sp. AC460]
MSTLAMTASDAAETDSVIIDGSMPFWAGLSFGTASFVNYLVLSGAVHLPHPGMIGLVWMGATAAFLLFGVILKLGVDPMTKVHPGFRRYRAVWGSLILGAMFLVGAFIAMLMQFGVGDKAPFISSPITLCIYGIGWRMAAVMSGRKWPNLLAVGAFLCAIYTATLAGTPQQYLVHTLCIVVFAVLPGLTLLLRKPAV